jgi:hypothetical protein
VFNASALTDLRNTQESSLSDECTIWISSGSSPDQDSYGQSLFVFSSGSGIACGYEVAGGSEIKSESYLRTNYDAIIRLAYGQPIAEKDRIEITKRDGVAVTPVLYEIVAPPKVGRTGTVVLASKTTW